MSVILSTTLSLIDVKTVDSIVTELGMDLDGYLGGGMDQVLSTLVHRGLRERLSLVSGVDQREGIGG